MASLTATLDTVAVKTTITLDWASGSPVPTTAYVTRVDADGTISAVRNAEPAALVVGVWIGDDYEAPMGTSFYYRATSSALPGTDVVSPSYTITADNGVSMLKHPGRPALNAVARVELGPNLTRPVTQGVFEVLGRRTPVAVSMRRSGARGDLSLLTFTAAERDALLLLLDDGTPLLLQTPSGYGLGNNYIAVGELNEERLTRTGYELARRWTMPFNIVDRPTGAALATGNTWADALAAYASWDALLAAEGTWAGLLEGLGS